MNELKIFENPEFGEIRTTEIDGKPYFCGSDVAKALGYANVSKALKDHCKGVTSGREFLYKELKKHGYLQMIEREIV